jgi:hypothetical protein
VLPCSVKPIAQHPAARNTDAMYRVRKSIPCHIFIQQKIYERGYRFRILWLSAVLHFTKYRIDARFSTRRTFIIKFPDFLRFQAGRCGKAAAVKKSRLWKTLWKLLKIRDSAAFVFHILHRIACGKVGSAHIVPPKPPHTYIVLHIRLFHNIPNF